MCKHILNAQVAVRATCCKRWFECPECHAEVSDHPLRKTTELVFACKKCKRTFRKDMTDYTEEDEYCPHCDNHYVIPAITSKDEEAEIVSPQKPSALLDARLKPPTEEELLELLGEDVSAKLG